MAVKYESIVNASLATVLTALQTNKIASTRIVNLFHNGTEYVAVYVIG